MATRDTGQSSGGRFAMTRGLVIGKFYPPHLGHSYLIDSALSQSDHLDVIVCSRPDQNISGSRRVTWLKELHPAANVLEVPDICDDDSSKRWADYTRQILGYAPDLVSTPLGLVNFGSLNSQSLPFPQQRFGAEVNSVVHGNVFCQSRHDARFILK